MTIHVSTCLWCGSDPSLNVPPTKSRGSESLNESGPGGGRVGLGQPVLQHASYTSSSYMMTVVLNLLWEENHNMINLLSLNDKITFEGKFLTSNFPMVTPNCSPRHFHLALASQVVSLTTFKCSLAGPYSTI